MLTTDNTSLPGWMIPSSISNRSVTPPAPRDAGLLPPPPPPATLAACEGVDPAGSGSGGRGAPAGRAGAAADAGGASLSSAVLFEASCPEAPVKVERAGAACTTTGAALDSSTQADSSAATRGPAGCLLRQASAKPCNAHPMLLVQDGARHGTAQPGVRQQDPSAHAPMN